MSDPKRKNEELTDIDLCYKALGLSVGDSPERIETTYNRLMDMYKNNMKSADAQVRDEAKNSLSLIADMYENIKASVTYQAMEKEYSKMSKRSIEAGKRSAAKSDAPIMKSIYKECPSCTATVSKSATKCPTCKYEFQTVTDRFTSQMFTRTNVIILSVIAVLAVVIVGYLNRALLADVINTFRGGE
jgi:hypothetical protein